MLPRHAIWPPMISSIGSSCVAAASADCGCSTTGEASAGPEPSISRSIGDSSPRRLPTSTVFTAPTAFRSTTRSIRSTACSSRFGAGCRSRLPMPWVRISSRAWAEQAMVKSLLLLVHRLPYPPTKRDKVRSYHLLLHLAKRYRVFLGAFVDDPADWPYVDEVRALCAGVYVEPIVRSSRRWRSLQALLTGEALALPYFRSATLATWVNDIVRKERIERAIAFSSPMAQYLIDLPTVRSIVDFVDLDSAKWADYAARRAWPMSALYGLEARRLFAFERSVAEHVDASVFVTREEARLLSAAAPESPNRIDAIENGVDSD